MAEGTGGYHPHESPLTILVPICLLAFGALLAGQLFHRIFVEPETAPEFWRGSVAFSEHLTHAAHEVTRLGQVHADDRDADRPVDRLEQVYPRSGRAGRFVATFPAVTGSCRTNGISTSFTTSCSSGRRCGSAACSGTAVTRARSTASARTARPYAVGVGNRVSGAAAERLSLFLRTGDAARPHRRRDLGDLVGAMTGLPLLTS